MFVITQCSLVGNEWNVFSYGMHIFVRCMSRHIIVSIYREYSQKVSCHPGQPTTADKGLQHIGNFDNLKKNEGLDGHAISSTLHGSIFQTKERSVLLINSRKTLDFFTF